MAEKFGVKDTYFSILTHGPLAGRPCFFIELNNSFGKKTSMRKLGKLIKKEKQCFMVHLSGNVYNEVLLTWLLDNNIITVVNTTSAAPVPEGFDWTLFESVLISPHVTINTIDIDKNLAKNTFVFRYIISELGQLDTDGLPKDSYRPEQILRIIVSPTDPTATERAVEICKRYGYYLDIDYKNYIGIR